MQARRVLYASRGQIGFDVVDLPEPGAGEVAVEMEYSMISPGTELAWLHELPGIIIKYPAPAGYTSVGRIIATGPGVENLKVGDRIAAQVNHQSHAVVAANLCHVVPAGVRPQDAAMFVISSISMGGVRKAKVHLGDSVAVLGLGIIGNLAGQLARAAGATFVAGVDPVGWRRDVAKQTGFDHCAASADELLAGPLPQHVRTRGLGGTPGFDAVIEATGVPAVVPQAFKAAARRGRVVLLGCPRGLSQNVDFYNDVHRKGIVVIGAHNAIRPTADETQFYTTASTDARVSLELLAQRRIDVAPLISDVCPVDDAPAAYARLSDRNQPLMTIALRWDAASRS